MILLLSTKTFRDIAWRRQLSDRLFTLGHLGEKILDGAVELLSQAQSLCKLCLKEYSTLYTQISWSTDGSTLRVKASKDQQMHHFFIA